ncbi:MAG TPA: hypothetical protein VJN18_21005 [Polyangiaceae bacterium]|nr:hypothetical protein [Polyangiaceae bacterium]
MPRRETHGKMTMQGPERALRLVPTGTVERQRKPEQSPPRAVS